MSAFYRMVEAARYWDNSKLDPNNLSDSLFIVLEHLAPATEPLSWFDLMGERVIDLDDAKLVGAGIKEGLELGYIEEVQT